MTRLFVNVGRNQGIRPQDIVGAIANEAGIPGRSIGAIDILDSYAFVDVPSDASSRVIDALRSSSIKGRPVNVEVAQPGAGRAARDDRRRQRDRGAVDGGQRTSGPRYEPSGGRRFDRSGPPRFRVRREEGTSRRPDRA
jgi:hypothetical protein